MIKNVIGWISAFIIVFAYYLLTNDYLSSKDVMYNALNLVGGIGLAYRVWLDRNYSNLFLEIIFITIALHAVISSILTNQ